MHRRTFIASMAALAAASPSFASTQQAQFPPPPPLRDDSKYLSVAHSEVFNGPRRDVIRSLQRPETGVLAFAERTPSIPGIERLQPLSGSFPNQNAVRQVFLTDGNSVVERVLRNDEEAFEYQIWNFTASNAWALDHIRGQFRYIPQGPSETRVNWTYSVAPAVFIARPFVNRFLTRDFHPFLTSGLSGAANAFNRSA